MSGNPTFEITVEASFSAAHAIVLGGQLEPLHGHDWHVTVTIAGTKLDREGLLCDFHAVERALAQIVHPWHNQNLNERLPFADTQTKAKHPALNPTAEHVAMTIGSDLKHRLEGPDGPLQGRAWVVSVRVTEAPGCAATCRFPVPIA